jgi:excisionase family DNA binding protein
MKTDASSYSPASSLPAGKITRKQLAIHCGLSLRYIDELTRNGSLPYFKIGKSIRYDLAEVEAALRDRFHVQPKARKVANKGTRSQS